MPDEKKPNGIVSGIEYPTLELGGVTYTLKFTRGALLYNASKSGVDFGAIGPRSFAALVDGLCLILAGQFTGTPQDMSNIIVACENPADKIKECRAALDAAWGKASPSSQQTSPEPAGKTSGAQFQ